MFLANIHDWNFQDDEAQFGEWPHICAVLKWVASIVLIKHIMSIKCYVMSKCHSQVISSQEGDGDKANRRLQPATAGGGGRDSCFPGLIEQQLMEHHLSISSTKSS